MAAIFLFDDIIGQVSILRQDGLCSTVKEMQIH